MDEDQIAERDAAAQALASLGGPAPASARMDAPRPASPDSAKTASMPAQGSGTPRVDAPVSGVRPVIPASAHETHAAMGGAAHTHRSVTQNVEVPEGSGQVSGRKRHRSAFAVVLIVLGIVLFLVAGFLFITSQLGYREAQETYTELQQYAVSSDEGDGVPNVDFDSLSAINSDIVGWIYIPGTVVNYPVVQTDDNTTYLTQLFDGSGNGSGTIFMDMADTAPGLIDQQTTIYGHHMYDGSMLKLIDNTTDQTEFDKIQTVYYITPDYTYTLKPLFTAQVEDTYLDVRRPNFLDEGTSLTGYLEDLFGSASAQASDASERIQSADKVVSLVTCAGEIIPRTTRAVMVLTVESQTARQ